MVHSPFTFGSTYEDESSVEEVKKVYEELKREV